ncbi:MAG: NAD+ synthase [Candidatus Aenigmatarchaeota archaeon]
MKIAMAQVNATVGDIEGNLQKIIEFIKRARENKANIVIFPELVVTGYPPQDLLYNIKFLKKNKEALDKISDETSNITAIVGFVDFDLNRIGSDGTEIKFNSAAIIHNKKIVGIQNKTLLPTYDVFDEARYFTPAEKYNIFNINDTNLGVQICEDLWDENYRIKVTKNLAELGSKIIVNLSASPFYRGKRKVRIKLLSEKSKEHKVPILYVNLVGGQDDLVFDGESLAVDENGSLIAIGKQFEEDLVFVDLNKKTSVIEPERLAEEEMFNALVLGLRDYCRKTGFSKVVLGLSGGIDSSLTAAIACEALGSNNVVGISMPSRYSSQHSIEDAKKLAENLGIYFKIISLEAIFQAYEKTLEEEFAGKERDVTEENLQARIRGNILMALSNKFGYLVLSTGNKTELALGYCTLYGDMSGGLAVISDLSKKEVYKLADYFNKKHGKELIPRRCFEKPPSAELRENQIDPFDYDIISPLVDEIIENRKSKEELIKLGFKENDIDNVIKKILKSEYKRKQAPPGIKITKKAFGVGWKMPIINKFTDL